MPTASANISAKFIAQIVIPVRRLASQSAPAVATSPEMDRTRGMPAAASEPKARSSTAIVSGHEVISERSIAALFSSLNSDHSAADPVRSSWTPSDAEESRRFWTRPAALTISAVPAPAPPLTTATWPSGEIDSPARGRRTSATARSLCSACAAVSIACRKVGSPAACRAELTTTASA